jgi:hypothetical protein
LPEFGAFFNGQSMLLPFSMLKQAKHPRKSVKPVSVSGIGQLSLVEHSLCPLDNRRSDETERVHVAEYYFSDSQRKRRLATARIYAPLGLNPKDEFYLWGLLALSMSQPVDQALRDSLVATPHWCLKQMGLVDCKSRRGGRQYQQFKDALERLSAVTYVSDACYDPNRQEYRRVSFGFLSYSLPLEPDSNRAWSISWDRTFFSLIQASGGYMRFDLEQYREFDPASRRMFLLLLKIGYRNGRIPNFDLQHLAINLLGFSPGIAIRDLKIKVARTLRRLEEARVIQHARIIRLGVSSFQVQMERGDYMDRKHKTNEALVAIESPLVEGLLAVGFDEPSAFRIIKRYPAAQVSQWTDVTLAALEKFGKKHFRKSPMAFMLDSLQKAAKGERTPPDWWLAIKRKEERSQEPTMEGRRILSKLMDEVFGADRTKSEVNGQPTSTAALLKSIL